jgi:hypothetical protein
MCLGGASRRKRTKRRNQRGERRGKEWSEGGAANYGLTHLTSRVTNIECQDRCRTGRAGRVLDHDAHIGGWWRKGLGARAAAVRQRETIEFAEASEAAERGGGQWK